jgi:hypothetical protein
MACLTDANFSISAEMRDTTCKETDGYAARLPSMRSATLSGSGLWAFDSASASNPAVIETAILNRTALTWTFGTGVTGDPKRAGTGYATKLELASPGFEENATYSFEISVTGAWTTTTY